MRPSISSHTSVMMLKKIFFQNNSSSHDGGDRNITTFKQKWRIPRHVILDTVLLIDALAVFVTAIVAKFVYVDLFVKSDQSNITYLGLSVTGALISFIFLKKIAPLSIDDTKFDEIKMIQCFYAVSSSFIALLLIIFLLRITGEYARGWLIIWFGSGVMAVVGVRHLTTRALRWLTRAGLLNANLAIIGYEPFASQVCESIENSNVRKFFFVSDMSGIEYDDDIHFSEQLCELVAFSKSCPLDQIIVALPTYDKARIQEILLELSPISTRVDFFPGVIALGSKRSDISYVGNIGLYNLQQHPINEWGVITKRMLDIVFSIIALIVLAIPMLVIAILIRLTSPGRAFFVQERHGLNNNVIHVLKFRTMVDKPRAGDHQVVKGDAEVTPIGRFLRRYSLDELPQFLNVLRGDMSVVGPRPHSLKMNEKFADLVQYIEEFERLSRYAARHKVKPGITGWAQVNHLRGETDTREKLEKRIEYDFQYINNWSLWFDIQIIFLTVWTVLKGENAH
jgi:putative colanic acid biosynthesis UDP-glucose lipid carrier transferase